MFDLNMEEGYRRRWRGSFGIVEDDHLCVVRPVFRAHDSIGEYRVTMVRRETEWVRSDVLLRQRCYRVDDVTGALAAEGFSEIRVLDAVQDLGLTEDVGRSFFLCEACEK